MKTQNLLNLITALLAASFLLLTQVFNAARLALGLPVPDAVKILFITCLFFLVLTWFENDRRTRTIALPLDTGVLVGGLWYLALPYYLFITRGRRALLLLLMITGYYGFTLVVGLIVYAAIKVWQ